jgi:glycogen debranching enzyme
MEELMSHYFGNLLSIFRYNSKTGKGVWALIRVPGETTVDEIDVPAAISSLAFEARINSIERFPDDGKSPLTPSKVDLFVNTDITKLKSVVLTDTHAKLVDFPVGTVAIFKISLPADLQDFLSTLEIDSLSAEFHQPLRRLTLIDLGVLLYRCESEEHSSIGRGPYAFPDFGPPFYAGTQGLETAFAFAAKSSGMGSSVFRNIRDGNWLITSMTDRLFQSPGLIPLEGFFRRICESTGKLPRFLVPKYLDRVVRAVNIAARSTICSRLASFIQTGDDLVQSLASVSVSFFTPVRNAQLVHPQLARPFSGLVSRADACTAAGFPHFSTGLMRSWGRDTFIALRGLFLVTGRFAEARDQLVAFAACLRHGLIPNLHDGGLNPRYNARDATWWFMQALQDYSQMSGDGGDVFRLRVPRLFPADDEGEHRRVWARAARPVVAMGDVVHEIMTRHANGIHFREWNAGPGLDSVMRP